MLSVLLTVIVLISPVQAQMATWDEAITVTNSWIARIMETEGHWGGYDWVEIEHMQEFTRNDRVVGYFFSVKPIGFIVVSLRKELAPVKAYSAECNLDPESDKGMADLLKTKMEGILDALDQPIRLFDVAGGLDEKGVLEIDYRPAWDELCGKIRDFSEDYESIQTSNSVSQIGPLLSTNWHQREPYNLQCPTASGDCTQERCAVGCVALAGAQIMKYWNWPPESFDWLHMADKYIWKQDQWEDGNGNPLDNTYTNAVSTLCRAIGDAVGMQYCIQDCESGSNIFDMNDAYGNQFFYHRYGVLKRSDNQHIWNDDIKGQLKSNRPIHYRIEDHQLVLDGWMEDGGSAMRQYHMNYGWGKDCDDPNGCNTWYSLDALYRSDDPNEEYIIADIYPAPALGDELSDNSIYPKEEFNYRYFDQDATGNNVTFAAGQNLQFLPQVAVTCTSVELGDCIRFVGTDSEDGNTRLFSIKGTSKAQINIYDGCIALSKGGGIRFH